MQVDKFYIIKVWAFSLFMAALLCACLPNGRTWPLIESNPTFAYRVGLFGGTIVYLLPFSMVFVFMYAFFYVLTIWYHLSDLLVRTLLILLCLVILLAINYFKYHQLFYHPFFAVYSLMIMAGFILCRIYKKELVMTKIVKLYQR